jgi:hypothetical protein
VLNPRSRTTPWEHHSAQGNATASVGLFLAMVFMCTTPSDVIGGKPETAGSNLMPAFEGEYPAAANRLQSALENVQGEWTAQIKTKADPDGKRWRVSFYKRGDLVRFDRVLDSGTWNTTARGSPNIGVLAARQVNARIHDPASNHAWADYLGADYKKVEMDVNTRLWRFLKAAYCIDGDSVLERIRNRQWIVQRAVPHAEQKDWVTLHCDVREGLPAKVAKGTVAITFSPREEWAVREYRYEIGPPFNYVSKCVVGDFMSLGDSRIPGSCRIENFDKTGEKTSGEDGSWSAEGRPPDEDLFTVESMGLGRRAPRFEGFGLSVLAGVLVIGLAAYARLRARPVKDKS